MNPFSVFQCAMAASPSCYGGQPQTRYCLKIAPTKSSRSAVEDCANKNTPTVFSHPCVLVTGLWQRQKNQYLSLWAPKGTV